MILQHFRIIVVDAWFDPVTADTWVWRSTTEPPHLRYLKVNFLDEFSDIFAIGLDFKFLNVFDKINWELD